MMTKIPKSQELEILENLIRERDAVRAWMKAALPIVKRYASDNPKYYYDGQEQDPLGVHALLEITDVGGASAT